MANWPKLHPDEGRTRGTATEFTAVVLAYMSSASSAARCRDSLARQDEWEIRSRMTGQIMGHLTSDSRAAQFALRTCGSRQARQITSIGARNTYHANGGPPVSDGAVMVSIPASG